MKKKPTLHWIWVTIASVAILGTELLPSRAAQFTEIVVPNSLNTTEGNSGSSWPFDGVLGSMRYQQVYDASEFSSIRNGGGYVTYIGFRTDSSEVSGYQTSASLQIDLSTTQKGPDTLSPVFADNVGPDDTIVRAARSITLFGSGGSTPAPFEVLIPLDTPFYYNPAAGNLLLDIRNYSGPTTPTTRLGLDAQNTTGDAVSSITAFDVGAASAYIVNSLGLVTDFGIQPVPEPSTWALVAIGLGTLALKLRWNRKRRRQCL